MTPPKPEPLAIGRKQQTLQLAREGLPPSEIEIALHERVRGAFVAAFGAAHRVSRRSRVAARAPRRES